MGNKLIVLVGSALAALVVNTAGLSAVAQAQAGELTTDSLSRAILARIPDISSCARGLGRGEERQARAHEHAAGIMAAAQENRARWVEFAARGHWEHFDVDRDLPLLIAALTYRESSFQPVIRLDGGAHVYELPVISVLVDGHVRRRTPTADMGYMQVRAPSRVVHDCGVLSRADGARLLSDPAFSYHVGTCVLTNHIEHYIDEYTDPSVARLRGGQRPPTELRFFGVSGPRRGTPAAVRARELLVIERYNWGNGQHYLHPVASGYARRILNELERFRELAGLSSADTVAPVRDEPLGG
jgi:hypothetical protein